MGIRANLQRRNARKQKLRFDINELIGGNGPSRFWRAATSYRSTALSVQAEPSEQPAAGEKGIESRCRQGAPET